MKLLSTFSSCLLVVGLAAAAAPRAHADEVAVPEPEPVGKLTPPAGWEPDVGRSRGLELAVGNEDHFGGVDVHVSAQHLRAPSPGGILLTTEIATVALPVDPGKAATIELHGVRSGLSALGDSVTVARWEVKPDPAARFTEARLEWSDLSLGTTTISRTLMFKVGDRVVRLTGECIIAADAGGLRGPCEAALATLAPLASVSARDALAVASEAPAPDVAPDATPAVAGIRPEAPLGGGKGPTISEREGEMPVTIVVDQPAKKGDRRPFYVLGGLVVILAVYLFNRRTKQRLAEADREEPARADGTKADETKAGETKADDEERP